MVEEKKEATNEKNETLATDTTESSENKEEQKETQTDTKPEESSEDTKSIEVKEEVKETKPDADAEKPEEKTSQEPPKKKKVNQMTLAEIEAQLKMVQERMGGFQSKYAQHLLRRKNYLVSNK